MDRLQKVGKIKTYPSTVATDMRFGIGFEKLDRNVFDPSKAYDKLCQIGVKRVRIQSGWARTEKKEGEYDFTWLDEIVDNLLKRGMKPWMCLCYGNGIYSPEANKHFGCVGVPPIFTEREKEGWRNYCKAIAEHYEGRVDEFEVWNEPDGPWCWKHGPNGTEYGNFVIETAKAVRKGQKDAKIYAGSFCLRDKFDWLLGVFQTGAGEYMDGFTYHDYRDRETKVPETVGLLRAFIDQYNPKIELIQGETGCQSKMDGHGAFCFCNWSEERQAKLLARRLISEIKQGVKFVSWFTAVDMIEALNGNPDEKASYLDYGYFGVLGAEFDENGYSIGEYSPKKSYYALQTVCALLQNAEVKNLPVAFKEARFTDEILAMGDEWENLLTASFTKPNGSAAYIFWKASPVLTTTYCGVANLVVALPVEKMRLVDTLTGEVFKIPEKCVKELGNGAYEILNVPVRDYPLALTFGDFFEEE